MSNRTRSRRWFLGGMAAAAALPLPVGRRRAFGQAAGRPRLHAMIIGMNVYTGHIGVKDPRSQRCVPHAIAQLHGCINDARAIEASVRPLAATTRVLLDKDVSRASFMQAWNDMVSSAAPGDTLLLTYAGHGGQERERVIGSEDDGLDETLILSPFDSCMPRLNDERIIDDEIAGLFQSVAGRHKVIFVADACHSGTMTRNAVDPRVEDTISYRFVPKYDFAGDLAGPVKIPTLTDNTEQPHVLFLAGAQDNELVPELMIDGRYQGALSLAFAQALAGRADTNQDGIITGAELTIYVDRTVRAFSDASQHSQVRWPHVGVVSGSAFKREDPVVFLGAATQPTPPKVVDAPAVKLRVLGGADAAAVARSIKRVSVVGPNDPAELVWDSAARRVLNQLGSVLAWDVAAADLQPVVDAAIALNAVRQLVVNSGIDMRLLLPGESDADAPSRASDRTHRQGTRLTLRATGLRHPYFVLFNINGNGKVEFEYPRRDQRDPPTVDPAEPFTLPLEVRPPFGADHVVCVSSARPPSDLVASLEALDGQQDPVTAVDALARFAKANDVLVGMQGIFTAAK
jgi:hypothetical protein